MNNYGSSMIQTGKWINKSTGNIVYVKQSLMDGDNLIIITDQGQLTMDEFKNYIQLEDNEIIPSIQDLYANSKPNGQLLAQINQGIDPEDRITLTNESKTQNTTEKNILIKGLGDKKLSTTINKQNNTNYDLIKRVFDKFPVERTIDFNIVDEEWPFKEFKMLVNVLDVPIKDICDYVIDNYLDKERLSKLLLEYFKLHIINEC